jgi:hypothetical protein
MSGKQRKLIDQIIADRQQETPEGHSQQLIVISDALTCLHGVYASFQVCICSVTVCDRVVYRLSRCYLCQLDMTFGVVLFAVADMHSGCLLMLG